MDRRGTLSMAHAGRDTGGSQFFLRFLPTPHLNGKHTAFGRVVDGFEVLAKLKRIDPKVASTASADKIIEAKVIRKRPHPYDAKDLKKSGAHDSARRPTAFPGCLEAIRKVAPLSLRESLVAESVREQYASCSN